MSASCHRKQWLLFWASDAHCAEKEIWYMPQRAVVAQGATWESIFYPSKKGRVGIKGVAHKHILALKANDLCMLGGHLV